MFPTKTILRNYKHKNSNETNFHFSLSYLVNAKGEDKIFV